MAPPAHSATPAAPRKKIKSADARRWRDGFPGRTDTCENRRIMLIDLHVHTLLSSDSNIAPDQYVEAAAHGPRRLDAICFTEHRLFPADPDLDRRYAELTEQFGVMVLKGIEADTNLGHLLLFGVTREVLRRFDLSSRMLKSDQLIEVVHGEGGIAIPAHPFRDSGFGPQLDDLLARHGAALGVIEALNGQNSQRENE